MDRSNHYEAAFEAYLQWHKLCYVAVDETRRAMLGEVPVKSLDFIVHGENGAKLLIDVKGRRFPGGSEQKPRKTWENWSTREDIEGLTCWTELFGPGYQAVLVFAYLLAANVALPEETDDLWTWRGRRYLLRAVAAQEYRDAMRVRSPKWGTVHLPRAVFSHMVRPLHYFTHGLHVGAEEASL